VITLSNALTAALAHLQTQGAGHSITLPYSAFGNVSSIDSWCLKNGVTYSQEGRFVTLEIDTTAGL
jgi:uncharacterized protein (DUF2237 family)